PIRHAELLMRGVGDRAEANGPGDEPLGDAAKLLRLGVRGLDPLVSHQIRGQRPQHRPAGAGVAAKLPPCFPVSHRRSPRAGSRLERRPAAQACACCCFQRSSIWGQLSNFIPKLRPIVAKISLISFSDLRPKFLVFSMSCSVFCTSSPISVMLAFCRQLAERTESSSSSTERNRLSFSGCSSWPAGW